MPASTVNDALSDGRRPGRARRSNIPAGGCPFNLRVVLGASATGAGIPAPKEPLGA